MSYWNCNAEVYGGIEAWYVRCMKCEKLKANEEFTPDRRTRRGLSLVCNDCKNPRNKQPKTK
jgi:NAD-dependent SIR2 family protein deacetylase